MQLEFPTSFLKSIAPAADRGHLIIDFPIKEISNYERKNVSNLFAAGDYPAAYGSFVAIAIIQSTSEYLIVPPEYAKCSIAMKVDPIERPANGYVNSKGVMKLLNLDNIETSNQQGVT